MKTQTDLKLVKPAQSDKLQAVESTLKELEDLLNDDVLECSRFKFSDRLDALLCENVDNGQQLIVVIDLERTSMDRQGLHHMFEVAEAGIDEAYQLLDLMERADRDGFGVIYIH